MKKFIAIFCVVCLLILSICATGCAEKSKSTQYNNSNTATATANPYSQTVYVSKTGKIHRTPNCSGMKYYTKMTYIDAITDGYKKCQNCY